MGSVDRCELSELVGLYLLNGLKAILDEDQDGLYMDDLLAYIRGLSGPQIAKIEKKLFSFFKSLDLKITIQSNVKQTDFLDIHFDLDSETHKPYRKEDTPPVYINVNSNHSPHIIKNLPTMISKRLSLLSSNEEVFNEESAIYNEGLRIAGYKEKVRFFPDQNLQGQRRKRRRNLIHFLPPWNEAVATPICKNLFDLLEKHFKDGTLLGRLFNKNTIRIGYARTPNMKEIIIGQNMKLLNPSPPTPPPPANLTQTLVPQNPPNVDASQFDLTPPAVDEPVPTVKRCSCERRGRICPVDGACERSNVVYSSLVSSSKGDREYIGSCPTSFKAWFNNHVSDSNLIHRRENTVLADHKWYLKERNIAFTQTWKLETFSRSYTPEAGYCDLCLIEKFMINKYHKARNLVNKRNEVFRKCNHRRKYLLSNF